MTEKGLSFRAQLESQIETHRRYFPALFFFLGFLFDILTMGPVDDFWTLVQQSVFIILAIFLYFVHWTRAQPKILQLQKSYRKWRKPIFHFIVGSLLSLYTLLFLKSASLASSFVFVTLISVVLILNEFEFAQKFGQRFRGLLLAFVVFCYFSVVIPLLFRSIGMGIFLLSVVSAFLLVFLFEYMKEAQPEESPLKLLFRSNSFIILILSLVLYFFKWIPPVPLSAQYMGIYHQVEKNSEGQYLLSHEKDWWRFWQNGDQNFSAHPGDQIFLFFRLFSPAGFEEKIFVAWEMKDRNGDWMPQDRIPISVKGGRAEGYRGYTVKSNYAEGEWRARLVTSDEREIGRLSLSLTSVEQPREHQSFSLDVH